MMLRFRNGVGDGALPETVKGTGKRLGNAEFCF